MAKLGISAQLQSLFVTQARIRDLRKFPVNFLLACPDKISSRVASDTRVIVLPSLD